MLVTLLGMVVVLHPCISKLSAVLISALQLSRESYTVFPASTLILSRLLQLKNAFSPMFATLLGMVMVLSALQLMNEELGIPFTSPFP